MIKTSRYAICAAFVAVFLLPGTPLSAQESGAEMWGRVCGRCHRALPPNKYDADAWRAIVGNMALTARLTPEEEEGITKFLMGAARQLAVGSPSGPTRTVATLTQPGNAATQSTVYADNCAVCHGDEGKGDGPIAASLTPRPPDLTQSELVGTMSEEELMEYVSVGKGAMPGFGKILTEEQLRGVVAWLRAKTGSQTTQP
jgi:mono/diheme cytochrome c family protein